MVRYLLVFLIGYFTCAMARNFVNYVHYVRRGYCHSLLPLTADGDLTPFDKCFDKASQFTPSERLLVLYYDGYDKYRHPK